MFDLFSLIYGITIIKKSADRAGLDHKTFDLLALQSSINKQELFQYLSHLNNQRASLTGLAHERIQMTWTSQVDPTYSSSQLLIS